MGGSKGGIWQCLEAASGITVVTEGVLMAVIVMAVVLALAAIAEAVPVAEAEDKYNPIREKGNEEDNTYSHHGICSIDRIRPERIRRAALQREQLRRNGKVCRNG